MNYLQSNIEIGRAVFMFLRITIEQENQWMCFSILTQIPPYALQLDLVVEASPLTKAMQSAANLHQWMCFSTLTQIPPYALHAQALHAKLIVHQFLYSTINSSYAICRKQLGISQQVSIYYLNFLMCFLNIPKT